MNNVSSVFLLDVDAPYDLAASNILIESGLLAWKPPRADITGYILSFESTDGTVRVSMSRNLAESGPGRSRCFLSGCAFRVEFSNDFSPRRWCSVLPPSLTTWPNSVPPPNIR